MTDYEPNEPIDGELRIRRRTQLIVGIFLVVVAYFLFLFWVIDSL